MKNFAPVFLIFITVLFVGIMAGILIGRLDDATSVRLSAYERNTTATTDNEHTIQNDTPGKININTATAKELAMLPGIGQTYAQRIVDYRNEHGLFASIYELENVNGIGSKRIQAISEYITVGG